MKKIVFASDQLPAELDDHARFSLWRDIYTSRYGGTEITRIENMPFSTRSEFTQVGNIGLLQFEGTFGRSARTSRHVAADPRGDFFVGLLRGRSRISVSQHGRKIVCAPGEMVFYTASEAFDICAEGASAWIGLCIPCAGLLERVADAEDLLVKPLDATRPAARHLWRYIDFLLGSDEVANDPQLSERISAALLDLVVLSLGANGDGAEIARMRGLRAARVQEILAEIKAGFADPTFSPHVVALKLGLSPRYVQDLLQETGTSFTDRVMELRLQKARAMLADVRHDRLKVSDIAFASGFGNVSYFNQAFRRRFGASPTQHRGGNSS